MMNDEASCEMENENFSAILLFPSLARHVQQSPAHEKLYRSHSKENGREVIKYLKPFVAFSDVSHIAFGNF